MDDIRKRKLLTSLIVLIILAVSLISFFTILTAKKRAEIENNPLPKTKEEMIKIITNRDDPGGVFPFIQGLVTKIEGDHIYIETIKSKSEIIVTISKNTRILMASPDGNSTPLTLEDINIGALLNVSAITNNGTTEAQNILVLYKQ